MPPTTPPRATLRAHVRRSVEFIRVTRNAYGYSLPEGAVVRLRRPALTVPGGVVVEAPDDARGWELLWPGEWAPWRPTTLAPPPPADGDIDAQGAPQDTAGGAA